jgi:hypothetical protein
MRKETTIIETIMTETTVISIDKRGLGTLFGKKKKVSLPIHYGVSSSRATHPMPYRPASPIPQLSKTAATWYQNPSVNPGNPAQGTTSYEMPVCMSP